MNITIINNVMICAECGAAEALTSTALEALKVEMPAFTLKHKYCALPKPEPHSSAMHPSNVPGMALREKVMWWKHHTDNGLSAETMCDYLTGNTTSGAANPSDSGDFGRCLKFLDFFPELADRFPAMKSLSPQWANLVNNWGLLTKMYHGRDYGLNAFIHKLTR